MAYESFSGQRFSQSLTQVYATLHSSNLIEKGIVRRDRINIVIARTTERITGVSCFEEKGVPERGDGDFREQWNRTVLHPRNG